MGQRRLGSNGNLYHGLRSFFLDLGTQLERVHFLPAAYYTTTSDRYHRTLPVFYTCITSEPSWILIMYCYGARLEHSISTGRYAHTRSSFRVPKYSGNSRIAQFLELWNTLTPLQQTQYVQGGGKQPHHHPAVNQGPRALHCTLAKPLSNYDDNSWESLTTYQQAKFAVLSEVHAASRIPGQPPPYRGTAAINSVLLQQNPLVSRYQDQSDGIHGFPAVRSIVGPYRNVSDIGSDRSNDTTHNQPFRNGTNFNVGTCGNVSDTESDGSNHTPYALPIGNGAHSSFSNSYRQILPNFDTSLSANPLVVPSSLSNNRYVTAYGTSMSALPVQRNPIAPPATSRLPDQREFTKIRSRAK